MGSAKREKNGLKGTLDRWLCGEWVGEERGLNMDALRVWVFAVVDEWSEARPSRKTSFSLSSTRTPTEPEAEKKEEEGDKCWLEIGLLSPCDTDPIPKRTSYFLHPTRF